MAVSGSAVVPRASASQAVRRVMRATVATAVESSAVAMNSL